MREYDIVEQWEKTMEETSKTVYAVHGKWGNIRGAKQWKKMGKFDIKQWAKMGTSQMETEEIDSVRGEGKMMPSEKNTGETGMKGKMMSSKTMEKQ